MSDLKLYRIFTAAATGYFGDLYAENVPIIWRVNEREGPRPDQHFFNAALLECGPDHPLARLARCAVEQLFREHEVGPALAAIKATPWGKFRTVAAPVMLPIRNFPFPAAGKPAGAVLPVIGPAGLFLVEGVTVLFPDQMRRPDFDAPAELIRPGSDN